MIIELNNNISYIFPQECISVNTEETLANLFRDFFSGIKNYTLLKKVAIIILALNPRMPHYEEHLRDNIKRQCKDQKQHDQLEPLIKDWLLCIQHENIKQSIEKFKNLKTNKTVYIDEKQQNIYMHKGMSLTISNVCVNDGPALIIKDSKIATLCYSSNEINYNTQAQKEFKNGSRISEEFLKRAQQEYKNKGGKEADFNFDNDIVLRVLNAILEMPTLYKLADFNKLDLSLDIKKLLDKIIFRENNNLITQEDKGYVRKINRTILKNNYPLLLQNTNKFRVNNSSITVNNFDWGSDKSMFFSDKKIALISEQRSIEFNNVEIVGRLNIQGMKEESSMWDFPKLIDLGEVSEKTNTFIIKIFIPTDVIVSTNIQNLHHKNVLDIESLKKGFNEIKITIDKRQNNIDEYILLESNGFKRKINIKYSINRKVSPVQNKLIYDPIETKFENLRKGDIGTFFALKRFLKELPEEYFDERLKIIKGLSEIGAVSVISELIKDIKGNDCQKITETKMIFNRLNEEKISIIKKFPDLIKKEWLINKPKIKLSYSERIQELIKKRVNYCINLLKKILNKLQKIVIK